MNDGKKPDGDSRFVATPDDFVFSESEDENESDDVDLFDDDDDGE